MPVSLRPQLKTSEHGTNTAARSALVLLLLLVAPISTAAQGLSKVNVVLNFAADGGAAGFYHALERGYFRELGLDVAIEPSKGSADAAVRRRSSRVETRYRLRGIAAAPPPTSRNNSISRPANSRRHKSILPRRWSSRSRPPRYCRPSAARLANCNPCCGRRPLCGIEVL